MTDGYKQLKNNLTKDCLYPAWNGSLHTTSTCQDTPIQRWAVARYTVNGVQYVRFRNQWTNQCIDDSSYGLRMFNCNTLGYQLWR